jgi:hypothetical protein
MFRITPPLGVLCILAIIFLIEEPERGKAERDQGAENVASQQNATYWQDIKYLMKNKTYIWTTIGYTSVVFVTGTLAWWVPTAINHASAAAQNLTSYKDLPEHDKSK